MFVLLIKKLLIESIYIPPIPSRSIKFSKIFFLLFSLNNSENLSIDLKIQLEFLHFPVRYA